MAVGVLGMGPSPFIDPSLVEQPLTEKEYLLRVEFVRVYMNKRNAYAACIEIGFLPAYAADWATRFMGEGIVKRLISQAEAAEDTPQSSDERCRKYRALMEHEATYYGKGCSHGSRVAALIALMKMEGMDAPAKDTDEDAPGWKGGVMLVPALTSPDEWGNIAALSQACLKQAVRD